jgi:2-polyprenyl-3-methyl-5-hydroxy-6-metoxy-1,4-benzoquinol methylase
MESNSHKTAISRNKFGTAYQFYLKKGLLKGRVLDFGCGKGQEADMLRPGGVWKYDPYYFPELPKIKFDTIVCNFVLNTLPTDKERYAVIEQIKEMLEPDGFAYIAVRNDIENLNGWTKRWTFQGEVFLPGYTLIHVTKSVKIYKIGKI